LDLQRICFAFLRDERLAKRPEHSEPVKIHSGVEDFTTAGVDASVGVVDNANALLYAAEAFVESLKEKRWIDRFIWRY